ncbi:DUF3135 domain-containing protein [Marinobacterium weihaiense]|uniref:DUF3135 domain-containing protein n=1 Tax=Marinobacterium weihaiense TaxID=2851016 RepID=A0ABS6MES0_9GAMM|nr:DUF3135 domain-containing protein [Marinobacterium weihaiense]MBV0934805.1 DUF3135 domain-containing protein [Marinobacterium weihaiense]
MSTHPIVSIPDFDSLVQLAQNDPVALEQLRMELVEQHIAGRPETQRQKLERMQFRINGVIRRASNPVHTCVLLNDLLMERSADLLQKLNQIPGKRDREAIDTAQPRQPQLRLVKKKDD